MERMHQPVILMRPGAANDRLAEALKRENIVAWRWPAYTITLPEDEALVAEKLSHLDEVEMVILASPAAVTAVAHWVREWPEHIRLATVGEGTARVIRAAWGESVPIVYPKGDAEHSGSEALFALIEKAVPSRVLIIRGQTGREWLSERLIALGADVEKLAAYVRVPMELNPRQIDDLTQAVASCPSPIIYITSTDAVATLLHAIKPVPQAREWLLRGAAITIHPRCEARLKEAGFTHVEITSTDDEAVASHIRSNLLRLR